MVGKRSDADARFFYRKVLLTSLVVFITVILLLFAALVAARSAGAAGPVDLTDAELAGITGQAGLTILSNGSSRLTADVIKFSDTDSSPVRWLEFRNFIVDDGNGGYYKWGTPIDFILDPADPVHPITVVADPVTLDVGTNASGQTLVAYKDSTHVSPRWYHVEDFVFCDQSLGSLHLDALSMGPSLWRYGAHADGTSGIDFDYTTKIYAQAFRYTYNSALEALTLSGIHLSGSATGDPVNPSAWAFSGNFKIGDIDGLNPAKMDIGTDADGVTSMVFSLPMRGSLRVENVTFGGNNFGPIAIDGIQVHRMNIQISNKL